MNDLNWCAMWSFLAVVFGILYVLSIASHLKDRHSFYWVLDETLPGLIFTVTFAALTILTWGA